MTTIQGYAATVTNHGKRSFAKFGGGLTKNFNEADVCGTTEEAWNMARRRGKTIYDVPGIVAIDAEGFAFQEGEVQP